MARQVKSACAAHILATAFFSCLAFSASAAEPVEITIGPADKGHAVPKTLWGIFFEDINWSADGGINPEMLANDGFDWREVVRDGIDWKLGEWSRFDKTVELSGQGAEFRVPAATVRIEPAEDGRMTLSLLVKGRRAVEFDNVSLQPVGPRLVHSGFRKDLFDRLAALKPAPAATSPAAVRKATLCATWRARPRPTPKGLQRKVGNDHDASKENPVVVRRVRRDDGRRLQC